MAHSRSSKWTELSSRLSCIMQPFTCTVRHCFRAQSDLGLTVREEAGGSRVGLRADQAVLGAEPQHADEAQRAVQAQHLHSLPQPRRRRQIHDLPAAAHALSLATPETLIFSLRPGWGLGYGTPSVESECMLQD